MTTEALALIVKAYTERSYDGNMMDLIHGLSKYIIYNKDKYYWKGLKYLLQPTKINILKAVGAEVIHGEVVGDPEEPGFEPTALTLNVLEGSVIRASRQEKIAQPD